MVGAAAFVLATVAIFHLWGGAQLRAQTSPYGELRVSHSSITVGRGIIAEGYNFRPVDLDARIKATSPLQTTRCAGRSPDDDPEYRSPEPPADVTKRFWGCSAGTATVSLVTGSTTLATATVTVTAPAPPPPPPPPPPPKTPAVTGFQVGDGDDAITMTTIRLKWNAGATGTEYQISRRKTAGGGGYGLPVSLDDLTTYADIGPLECYVDYTYRIRARSPGKSWSGYTTVEVRTAQCGDCNRHNLGSLVFTPRDLSVSNRPWTMNIRPRSGDYPDTRCKSKFRLQPRYTVEYRFYIGQRTHLQIYLDGKSGADATLALVEGDPDTEELTHGDIREVNNSSSEHGPPDAQIAQIFDADAYVIEVSLDGTRPAGASYTLTVAAQEPMPRWGHQRDHTIRYVLGDMPESPPPPGDPGSDPGDGDDENFGTYLHDSVVLPDGIIAAARQWHSQVGESWPNLVFCRGSANLGDNDRCPTGANDDRVTVTVMTVTEGTCDTRSSDGIACVDFDGHVSSKGHILVPDMFFEHPTYVVREDPMTQMDRRYKLKWVADRHRDMDNTIITVGMEDMYAAYAKAVALHEFGHVAGLSDLADYEDLMGNPEYPNFLMTTYYKKQVVPDNDIRYLNQVYRNEHGAAAHREDLTPLGRGEQ